MLDESRAALAKHRVMNSKEDYLSAIDLIKGGHYKVANNRAYYSIFHAIRAVLALDGIDFKKHSAVISYFNHNYIKTEKFEKRFYKVISDASLIRNESDYSDFYVASKEEAEKLLGRAKEFRNVVEMYVNRVISDKG